MMPTFEQVRQKVRRNCSKNPFPERLPSKLMWVGETAATLISSCKRYRVSKVAHQTGHQYFAWCLRAGRPAEQIGGVCQSGGEARVTCQAHLDGEPIQAEL